MPDAVVKAYGDQPLQFGPKYIIPKPVDPRVPFEVAPAVAEAAMDSGAARSEIDADEYVERLEARLGKSREMRRVALAEGTDEKMIRTAYRLQEESIAEPVLIGDRETITRNTAELGLDFDPEVADRTTVITKSTRSGCTLSASAGVSPAAKLAS